MTDEPGAQPAETSLPGGSGAALPARLQALAGTFTPVPWSSEVYGLTGPLGVGARSKNILFIAWRDLANRRAGGSEVLVDRLASGMVARGHRVTLLCGGEEPDPPAPRSPEPLFLAIGRLTDYKRLDLLLRLWDRVRHVVGGKLVIAGDGPERSRLESLAGPGVEFTGRVSDAEKHRLMCAAWLFLHPALMEGWGIVVAEAAIRGTPSVAFDVPGLRDSVLHGQTGMLVRTEGQFTSEWASLAIDRRRREQLGQAARTRALQLHWSAAVDGFADVADEAIKRARIPS